jgi:hypothetical protein
MSTGQLSTIALQEFITQPNLVQNLKIALISNIAQLNLEYTARIGLTHHEEPIPHLVSSRLNLKYIQHIIRQVSECNGMVLSVTETHVRIDWSNSVIDRGSDLRRLSDRNRPSEAVSTIEDIEVLRRHVLNQQSTWSYLAMQGFDSIPVLVPYKISNAILQEFARRYPVIGGIHFKWTDYGELLADWSLRTN